MEALKLIVVTFVTLFVSGTHSVTFTIQNHCPYTIWPGTMTGGGKPQLSSTGFELASGASTSLNAPSGWSGRMWARTWCSNDPSGKFTCRIGDCGSGQIACNGAGAMPPATLVEFTLAGYGGNDYYDVSLVDGFNLPVTIAPEGGSDGGLSCKSTACPADLNAICPSDLAMRNPEGYTIGCKSACLAFNKPEFCCTGNFATPVSCKPSDFSKVFKSACPQAYSYAYDDKSSTFVCGGGPNYHITFCP
ncbi:thaumatin-like protein 1 [Cornus florida]|uniref:thaumatin-like protein 1 n=1 Tax=Cornus florida TaxID=4283 RepID=UPI00289FDA48|nr:thaumatin-like protein 1 [Cornus florida]